MNLGIWWAMKYPPVGSFTTADSSDTFERANEMGQRRATVMQSVFKHSLQRMKPQL